MTVKLQEATGHNSGRTDLLFVKGHKRSVNQATQWLD